MVIILRVHSVGINSHRIFQLFSVKIWTALLLFAKCFAPQTQLPLRCGVEYVIERTSS